MNEYWSNLDILSLDELKIEGTKFIAFDDTRPIIDYLDDHFKMNDKVENATNESEFIIESKATTHNAFDNAFSNMINRTYIRLRSTMGSKIKIQEVARYALSIQTEMLQDEKMIEMYQNDPDDFILELSINVIKMAYDD